MADPKEPATLKPAHKPRPWRHHKTVQTEQGERPVPPGRTMVYSGPDAASGVVCEDEDEYRDHLNRGYKDTCAPEAWA